MLSVELREMQTTSTGYKKTEIYQDKIFVLENTCK
jgi:hypothetical protein